MGRFSIIAVLTFASSAAAAWAQAPAQTPQLPPAQTAPAPRPAGPRPGIPAAVAPQPPAPFPQGAKIAFVDFQRVAQESIEGQASSGRINQLVQKKQAEGAERAKLLQANQQKLQQSGGVMSEQARTQLEKDIERQQREAERFQQDAQAEINELQQELQLEFQKKVIPVVSQVAQEKGLHMLLSRVESGVVWWDAGVDLTAEIVKRLDAATPKPAAAGPAATPPAPVPPPAAAPPAAPKK